MIGTVQEGRYHILRKLGEGGQGEVYLAEHVHLGRHEAIKVLREEVARDEDFVSRFRREARAANRVQHPHIVGVYDFGRLSDGRYFLAMEYVDGERLDHVIGGAPVGVRRAVRIAAQLGRALGHAHALGVVHRDLKPMNIILTRHRNQADVVKVLDFGMAKIIAPELGADVASTLGGRMLGTAPYMAPEQFRDHAAADPRMDVYGAGCILYELLTGATPFTGGMVAQMDQHMRTSPERPSRRQPAAGIPRELDELVLRALAKRPEERFADGGALADALEALAPAAPAAPAPPRKTRLGVAIPRPLDDFAGETDTHGGGTHGGTDPGGRPVEDPIVTGRMSRAEAVEIAGALVDELADALLDRGVADAVLVAGAAQLRDLRRQAHRLRGEAAELEANATALEHSVRERQASLSFAIGELSFDRDVGEGAAADVDAQIEALEASLAALGADARARLAALDERALAVAAALDDSLQAQAATAARLAPVIDAALARVPGAHAAPLRAQLERAHRLLAEA